ncbi:hypothetical protein OIE82_27275 [Streptomyces althioticus]|jgi:hypothetical protein|uniref:Uncharacterized protein n=1 Tax=Streptomyces althioticus TaxID=83380 RepID=A0ABZ1YD90_9ACTN
MAWMEVEVDLERLAFQLAEELNQVALMKFLVELDANVGDVQFTEKLIQNLQASLEDEVF